jgi:hypothetical protein
VVFHPKKVVFHPKKVVFHPKKVVIQQKNMRITAPLQTPKILKTFKSIKNIQKGKAKNFILL